MANSYCQVSFRFPATDAARHSFKAFVAEVLKYTEPFLDDPTPSPQPPDLKVVLDSLEDYIDFGADFAFDVDEAGWIYCYGSDVNPDPIAELLRAWLRRHNINQTIAFEVGYTCSKPRLDSFGGGVVLVTPKLIVGESTVDLMNTMLAAGNYPPQTLQPMDGDPNVYVGGGV